MKHFKKPGTANETKRNFSKEQEERRLKSVEQSLYGNCLNQTRLNLVNSNIEQLNSLKQNNDNKFINFKNQQSDYDTFNNMVETIKS